MASLEAIRHSFPGNTGLAALSCPHACEAHESPDHRVGPDRKPTGESSSEKVLELRAGTSGQHHWSRASPKAERLQLRDRSHSSLQQTCLSEEVSEGG